MKTQNSRVFTLIMMVGIILASILLMSVGARLSQTIENEQRIEVSDRILRLYLNQRFKQNDEQDVIEIQDDNTLIFHDQDFSVLVYEEEGNLVEQVSTEPIRIPHSGQIIGPLSQFKVSGTSTQITVQYLNEEDNVIELNYTVMTGIHYD